MSFYDSRWQTKRIGVHCTCTCINIILFHTKRRWTCVVAALHVLHLIVIKIATNKFIPLKNQQHDKSSNWLKQVLICMAIVKTQYMWMSITGHWACTGIYRCTITELAQILHGWVFIVYIRASSTCISGFTVWLYCRLQTSCKRPQLFK